MSRGIFEAFESSSLSIFQSKNDPETWLRFQYRVILKSEDEEAAWRPSSFLEFWCWTKTNEDRRRKPRVGKWETCLWFSTFPSGAQPGCVECGISRGGRDFQGTVERVEKRFLLFHAFHGPVISIALPDLLFQPLGGDVDSILHRRNSCILPAAIFRAHSVSLIFCAVWSSCAKPRFGFKYCSGFASDFSFS